MKIEQKKWTAAARWIAPNSNSAAAAQLVLVFGATSALKDRSLIEPLKKSYPAAHIFGCSTAGEICDSQVTDDTLIATAVEFEHTQLKGARIHLNEVADSFCAGEHLAQALPRQIPSLTNGHMEKLAHVFVLSDGLKVNGSDLVR